MCVGSKGELWVLFLRGLPPIFEISFPTGLELCTLGWWSQHLSQPPQCWGRMNVTILGFSKGFW